MSIGLALLIGFGLVFVIEGLVFALFPGRIEDLMRLMADIPVETRRIIGLSSVGLGVVIVGLALGAV